MRISTQIHVGQLRKMRYIFFSIWSRDPPPTLFCNRVGNAYQLSLSLFDPRQNFFNCSCISEGPMEQPSATTKPCQVPDCNLVPLFMVIFFFAMFFLFSCSAMNITATVRCAVKFITFKFKGKENAEEINVCLGW